MAYETPTAADLKARYPEFDSVADARVDVFIEEALSFVGTDWDENDYKQAIIALACHNLVGEGEPARSNGGSWDPANSGQVVKSHKVGDVAFTFENGSGGSSGSASGHGSEFSQTVYGKKYKRLQAKNVVSVRCV